MKKTIVVTGITLLVLSFYYLYMNFTVPEYEPTYTILELKSDSSNIALFLKKKVWGITSDRQVIVISASEKNQFDPDYENEYVYSYNDSFLYEFRDDTLKVYVRIAAKVPPNFDSNLEVEQVVLTNLEMMNLLDEHEERGIKLFK